jgi:tape measure domain-containing protein
LGLKAYGATATEASSAMLQLSQAFGANRLGGEEFRAVSESMPNMMKVLAASMGVPLSALKALSAEGKITSEVMMKAWDNPALIDALRKQADLTRTITGEFAVMRSNLKMLVGEFMGASGSTGGITSSIRLMSDAIKTLEENLKTVLLAVTALSLAYAGQFIVNMIRAISLTIAHSEALAMNAAMNLASAQAANFGAKAALAQGAANALATGESTLATAASVAYRKSTIELAAAQTAASASAVTGIMAVGVAMRTAIVAHPIIAATTAIAAICIAIANWKDIVDSSKASLKWFQEDFLGGMEFLAAGVGISLGELVQKLSLLAAVTVPQLKSGEFKKQWDELGRLAEQSRIEAAARIAGIGKQTVDNENLAAIEKFAAERADWEKLTKAAAKAAAKELSDAQKVAGKLYEEEVKARQQYADSMNRETASIESKTAAVLLETESIGKTKAEIDLLQAARYDHETQIMRETLATYESAVACTVEAEALKAAIAVREAYKKTQTDQSAAHAKQAVIDAETKAHEEMWKKIDGFAHDAFDNILDKGKTAFEEIGKVIKKSILDMLYRMTVQKFLINVGVAGAGIGASGVASAAGVDGGGSWLSAGGNVFNALKMGFTDLSASFTSMAGTISGALQSFGVAAETAGSIGIAGAYVGGGMAGISLGTMIAGDKTLFGISGQNAAIIGTSIGMVIGGPIGGVIGGALGGIANAAFGMGAKQSGTTTLAGTFGQGGFAGGYQTPWSQKGGWFRSNKSGIDTQGIGAEQATAFSNVIAGTEFVFAKLAALSGEATTTLDAWSFAINRQVATQEQQNTLIIDIANSMGAHMIPRLSQFQQKGENLADTAVRLTDEVIILDKFFYALGSTAKATIDSADALATALGGVANSAQLMTSFIGTFAPTARQTALTLEALTGAGLPMAQFLTTTEAWWTFAQTASAEQLTAILKNQGAIKSWVDAMGVSTKAVQDNIKALRDKSIADYKAAMDATKSLRAFALSVRELQRSLLVGSLSSAPNVYGIAKSQFETTNALAGQGDAAAQGRLSGAATTFLDAAKRQAVSVIGYAQDFAMVQNALSDTADATDRAVTAADRQLEELVQANAWLAAIASSNQTQSLTMLLGTAASSAGAVNSVVGAQQSAVDAQAIGAAQAIAEAKAASDAKAAADAIAAAAAAARQAELNVLRSSIPTTYLVGQSGNPYWEAQLSSWRAQHIAKFGFAWDAPWGTNAATSGSYDMLRAGYLASIPSFAVGINAGILAEDTLMQAHGGEEIKPATYVDRDRAARNETNTLMARLVASNDETKSELKAARLELVKIRTTNERMWQIADKHDIDGMPEVRVA